MLSGRNSCKRKEALLKLKSRRVADAMIPIRLSGSILVGLPGSGLSRQAAAGRFWTGPHDCLKSAQEQPLDARR